MLIAMANGKGGCAKSTTSVHLCHWLHKRGKSVALIDADLQATSSMWLNSLQLTGVRVESIDPDPDALLDMAADIKSKYDFVVIDGPGGMVEVVRAALLVCDLAILPIQPTGPDVRAAGEALKLLQRCRAIRDGLPQAYTYLTRVNTRTKAYKGAVGTLEKQQAAPLLKGMITARQVVQDGYSSGKTSFTHETGPGLEAAREFDLLFKEMLPDV